MQVKLLRLLETYRYRRVGSPEVYKANFRLICATNQDLPALVESGDFRADLFYRLADGDSAAGEPFAGAGPPTGPG